MCKNIHSTTTHYNLQLATTQISINSRTDKLWYSHTMKYYAAMRMNKIKTSYNTDESHH